MLDAVDDAIALAAELAVEYAFASIIVVVAEVADPGRVRVPVASGTGAFVFDFSRDIGLYGGDDEAVAF